MPSAKEQLHQHIDELPNELAEEVLDFLLFVKSRRDRPENNGNSQDDRPPSGTSGKEFLKFVGLFPKNDLEEMTKVIAQDCNRIDIDEW